MSRKLTKKDIDTLRYARWPDEGAKHDQSAKRLAKTGLVFNVGGEIFITDLGKRALLDIEES